MLAADVGDHPEAYTRFVAVSNRTELGAGESWRIAFSFQTDHRPGALHRAIEPFARHALDLVQLTSRPIPQTPWRYRFDAVVAGHPLDDVVRTTLAEVREQAQRFTVFGSYPAWTLPALAEAGREVGRGRSRLLHDEPGRAGAAVRGAEGDARARRRALDRLAEEGVGIETDLTFDVVQQTGLAAGLVDNKSCAIDEHWQALRFVYRLMDR